VNIYTTSKGDTPDLDDFRGRSGVMSVEDLIVEVKITDARFRFGHLDLLVTPVAGEGERWVEQHRVTVS